LGQRDGAQRHAGRGGEQVIERANAQREQTGRADVDIDVSSGDECANGGAEGLVERHATHCRSRRLQNCRTLSGVLARARTRLNVSAKAIIRGWHARAVLLPAARKEYNRRRKQIMREIVSTESTYLQHLKTLIDLYQSELRVAVGSGQLPGVSRDALADIFPPSTDDIKRTSEELLKTLNKQLGDAANVDDLRFGRVFLELAPQLGAYSQFVKDFTKSIEAWTRLLTNDAWQTLLGELKQKSGSKWDLSMFLIVPVQRVPRYELLLKQLLAHTLPSNGDYVNTANALALVQSVNERINKDKRIAEERREVAQTLARISKLPDDHTPSRRVVRAGELLSTSFSAEKERSGKCQRKVRVCVCV
jgi:hypothetical protein